MNEYAPGGASAERQLHHGGFEYGVIVEGSLTVHIEDSSFSLKVGDLVSYPSSRSHQIENKGDRNASAVWINVDRS